MLEAFAHRRPVVATPTAVAGLGVAEEREALIAESPDDLATAVARVLDDTALRTRLVDQAVALIDSTYRRGVVAPLVRDLLLGA